MKIHCPFIGLQRGCLLAFACLSLSASAQTDFGSVDIGRAVTRAVTVRLSADVVLNRIAVRTQGAEDLDFTIAGGGTCVLGTTYLKGAACTLNVTFKPGYAGTRNGAAVLESSKGVVATIYLRGAGIAPKEPRIAFLPGAQTTILSPVLNSDGAAIDGGGNVYLASESYRTGGPVPPRVPGAVSKFILSKGEYTETTIGSGFGSPVSVAVDGGGNIYIADYGFNLVYYWDGHRISDYIPPNIYKETLEPDGSYTQSTIGSDWNSPSAVAVDGSGNVYVTETGVPVSGAGTLPGVYKETLRSDGSYARTIIGSGWNNPYGDAVDGNGNVYVADPPVVYKETPQSNGSYTKTAIVQGLSGELVVDGSGNLFIANGALVYKETLLLDGTYAQGVAATTKSGFPSCVAVDAGGNLYIGYYDSMRIGIVPEGEGMVVKVIPPDPPALSFAATAVGSTSTDSPQTVAISNTGDAALKFSELSYPPDFPEAGDVTNECTSGTSLQPGEVCELNIDFKPIADTTVVLRESVTITTNGNNGDADEEAMPVSGTELNSNKFTPSVQLTSSVNPSGFGNSITFEAAVTTAPGGAMPTGEVTFYSGATALYNAALQSGVATYTTSSLAVGTHRITATYQGDSNYLGVVSNAIAETILALPPTYVIGDVNIGTVPIGKAVSAIPVNVTFNVPETLGSIAVLTQGAARQDFIDAGSERHLYCDDHLFAKARRNTIWRSRLERWNPEIDRHRVFARRWQGSADNLSARKTVYDRRQLSLPQQRGSGRER